MNPDQPSREHIEARITALLLGELPADEAELLRYTIAHDAALKKLHDELAATIVLVREAVNTPADAPAEKAEPLKLSDERREKLLAHFKTAPKDEPLFWLKRIEAPRLIVVLACVALVALLAATLLPALSAAKSRAKKNAAQYENLSSLSLAHSAKVDNNKAALAASDEALSAAPATPAPPVAAATPAPVVAPPQVAIALPPAGYADTSGVYSQDVVGYVNTATRNSSPVQVDVLDKDQAALVKNDIMSGAISPGSSGGGFGGGSSGGGGGGTGAGNRQEVYVVKPGDNLTKIAKAHGTTVEALKEANNLDSSKILAGARMKLPEVNESWSVSGSVRGNYPDGSPTPAPAIDPNTGLPFGAVPAIDPNTGLPPGSPAPAPVVASLAPSAIDPVTGLPVAPAQPQATFSDSAELAVNTPAPQQHKVDTQNRMNEVEKSWVQPHGQTRASSVTTVINGYNFQGGTGQVSDNTWGSYDGSNKNPTVFNNGTIAFGGSGGGGAGGENQIIGYRGDTGGSSGTTLAFRELNSPATLPASAALPAGQFPDLASAELPNDAIKTRKLDVVNADQIAISGTSQFYRAPASGTETEKVRVIGDIPVTGSLFKSSTGDIAASTPPAGSFDLQVTNGLVMEDQFKSATSENKPATEALTLNGVNAFAGKASDRDGGEGFKVQPDHFYSGLATDDVSGRYPTDTNTVIAVDTLTGGLVVIADVPTPNANKKAFQETATTLSMMPVESDERRKLSDMEQMHTLLLSKVKMAKIDYDLPIYTMVQITDPAKVNKNQSLWQEFRGEYASTATMKIENEGAIISNLEGGQAAQNYTYDPFFVQTTFEVMKSQLVLSNVVNNLNLETKWAASNGGQKLSMSQAMERLKSEIDLAPVRNTKMVTVTVTSGDPQEAADLANAIAKSYQHYRESNTKQIQADGLKVLESQLAAEEKQIQAEKSHLAVIDAKKTEAADRPLPKSTPNMPIPQPEVLCTENNFSTFALNVSDVSFQLAAASLEHGQLPDPASIRSEEFINAFDYRDPEAAAGQPMAFTTERARYPFAQNRDLLRFSVKTAAIGRPAGRALNLVVLLDISGSMERADRVAIIREALRVLASQLQPQDTVSVVTFARTARLWADGVSGDKAGETLDRVGGITPEGGTNLEEAMRLAYATARRHYLANGMNRVVLLTDGAANLGDVDPNVLKHNVETQRKQGIALDCFGVGFEDYNDDLLEQLSSHADGRYAFLNSPEDASKEFATKLAGALQIAAQDVKVQVEFNPERVTSWRQIGYATHQLTKQQFRDNTVAAGEIAAQEAGNALYTVETKPDGSGPVATVRVRYRVPGTQDYQERSWLVQYTGTAPALEQSSPAMRLAATASAFSEWLATSPFAQEVSLDELQKLLTGVPQVYGADERPKKLETMLREAKSISGK